MAEPGEAVIRETKAVESADKNLVNDRVEKALARSMKTAAQYCLLSMAVLISFRTLSVAVVHP